MKTPLMVDESVLPSEHEDSFLVRRSSFVYLSRIFVAGCAYAFSIICVYFFLSMFSEIFPFNSVILFEIFFIAISMPIFILFSSYIHIRWLQHVYIILPNAVIERNGVFYKEEKNFACNRIESITVTQSPLGQFLNFGTITLFDPFLEKNIYLRMIEDPNYYADILRKRYVISKPDEVRFIPAKKS